jgi:hypothetical protein
MPLQRYSIPTLYSAGNNDPEEPEKYKNTEVKNGTTFYSCHTGLDLTVVQYKDLETK